MVINNISFRVESKMRMFKKKQIKEQDILAVLEGVVSPLSAVKGLQVSKAGDVVFMIEIDPSKAQETEPMRLAAEEAVRALKGVKSVSAILTAHKEMGAQAEQKSSVPDPHGMEKNPKLSINAKKIIAVASGKGGVGKSTVSAGLARSLAAAGKRVGLLDADIYGPSQPTLFGLKDFKPEFTDENKIIPAEVDGVRIMSIGFMVDAEKALVWRGPMVQSAIYQMFRDVEWAPVDAPLDVLVVDMPPGTGDAQLTLAQKIDVDGAVIVSTPQELALADARKAVEMFGAVDVPILGLTENMSSDIFGRGGAKIEAKRLAVPFLGEIPLDGGIREKADAGHGYDMPSSLIEKISSDL